MIKEIFHTDNGIASTGIPLVLSLRAGSKYASFAVTSADGSTLYSLSYYVSSEWNTALLEQLYDLNPSLHQRFYAVKAAFDHPASVLLPIATYRYEEAGNLSSVLWGGSAEAVLSEAVPSWQVQNIYSVPDELRQWVTKKFPEAKTWHAYSVALRTMGGASPEGCLLVDIRKDDFSLVAAQSGKLLLAQVYPYETPDDIIYYLLSTTSAFGLQRESCELKLSGLIDRESALYRELYLYFINISFRETGWSTGDHPAHFFTSLNDLARCE